MNCQQENQPFRLTLLPLSPLPNAMQHLICPRQPRSPPSKYQKSPSVRSCRVRRFTAAPSGEREESSQVLGNGRWGSRKCIRGHGQVKDVPNETSRASNLRGFSVLIFTCIVFGCTLLFGVAGSLKTQICKLAVICN